MAVEHVGLFFVAKKAGVRRFIIDAPASNRHFLNSPSGPLLTGDFPMSNFWGRLRTLETGLWARPISRTRFVRCAFHDGCKRILHFGQSSHPRLLTLEK